MLSATPAQTKFLSTPSARRATRQLAGPNLMQQISIHALREEGDRCRPRGKSTYNHFYPRPPRGGRPPRRTDSEQHTTNFYPRPPRGGRHAHVGVRHLISGFLSTPSARRATESARTFHLFSLISIHALREEGDEGGSGYRLAHQDFYPRPPRGGRLALYARQGHTAGFLSTPSARRATTHRCHVPQSPCISIHALREEGDQCRPAYP